MTAKGEQVIIPVCQLEFREGGNTIWVHSPLGATVLRLKVTGQITSSQCSTNPVSHADAIIQGDLDFCLSNDVEIV